MNTLHTTPTIEDFIPFNESDTLAREVTDNAKVLHAVTQRNKAGTRIGEKVCLRLIVAVYELAAEAEARASESGKHAGLRL